VVEVVPPVMVVPELVVLLDGADAPLVTGLGFFAALLPHAAISSAESSANASPTDAASRSLRSPALLMLGDCPCLIGAISCPPPPATGGCSRRVARAGKGRSTGP
jgi:hypothetical protein